ncbi:MULTISPECIES: sulfotransferase [unclassified Guyparkeria]|uniref:sulfotransferase n=1 Tax=unclassified Guyparkeria TaxID=2626246 RepID=UPI0012E361CD|nr:MULTISPECIES: sulfotransferase [unclassified Guyparkeria]
MNALSIARHEAVRLWCRPDRNGEKVFCIGRNKTGTTTLAATLRELGYRVAPQRRAEIIADNACLRGDFDSLVDFCGYYEAFQDAPFSWPGAYRVLDREFPNAKFLLSVRDSPDQWYESLLRFHAKMFGQGGNLPTMEDLKKAEYVHPGFIYRSQAGWGHACSQSLYDRGCLVQSYVDYNSSVERYFSGRPGKLLIINVARPQDCERLCVFLGRGPKCIDGFPWENKT